MKKVLFHERIGSALRKQRMTDVYEFPFTLNPTIGCLFACKYCYVQQFPFNRWAVFGEEVKVKPWMPARLDRELDRLRGLPQHLKRVQVGNAAECYSPEVMARVRRELGRDLMGEILDVFRRHWNVGNQWAVHIITKSHLVGRHVEILSAMRDQVQVEVTLVCLDEGTRREYERYAPSVRRRLEVIQRLAEAGVFVRVMAMPLLCGREEALELRRVAFECGARGFKVKGLNYFEEEEVRRGEAVRRKRKEDVVETELLVNSGELLDGRSLIVPMPTKDWRGYEPREMPVLRSGYSEMSGIDWGYLV